MVATILVVDDNPMAVDLVIEVLEPEGFEVISCQEPAKALELAHRADAMVLDVMMPEISGFEVLKMLRKDPLLKYLPVLMLSALGEGDDRAAGLEGGADDYLGKPFHGRELVLRIRKLLDKRKDPELLLEGNLGPFTVGNILQQILDSSRNGVLRIEGSRSFIAGIREGKIVSASLAALMGREALLAVIATSEGYFSFRAAQVDNVGPPESMAIQSIMMEAAWLQDELEKFRDDIPAGEAPQFFSNQGAAVDLPRELAGLEVQEIADWLAANPGSSRSEIQEGVHLAPDKISLALAWLNRSGFLEGQEW